MAGKTKAIWIGIGAVIVLGLAFSAGASAALSETVEPVEKVGAQGSSCVDYYVNPWTGEAWVDQNCVSPRFHVGLTQ